MIAARKYGIVLSCFFIIALVVQPGFSTAQPIAAGSTTDPNQVPNYNSSLRINEVNARAARHFANHFNSEGNEKWVILDGFYIASFTTDGVRTEAFYTSRGGYAYTVRYYQANRLNENIRLAVLRRYKDHSIDVVTEISNYTGQVYFVKIKNSSNIKMVRITGNEMEVTEDFANIGG